MHDNLLWLASYPKTGSTWLRIIIREIIAPGMEASEAIPAHHKEMPSDAPLHDIWGEPTKIVKTHCHPDSNRLSRVTDKCVGVMTIHRHPLDVMLSSLNYLGFREKYNLFKDGKIKSVDEIIADGEMDYYIDQFIENDGVPTYKNMCGPWSVYDLNWQRYAKDNEIPYLGFCYEDMVANPMEHIGKLCGFLGIDADEDKLKSILGHSEKLTTRNGRFYWKKRAYNFQHMLTPPMIRRFERHYEPVLQAFGYT